jgi:TonB-linked SusC/RagA family outer membrane protein
MIVAFGVMFCPDALAQQTGTVTGTVTDSLSGQSIPGVNVVVVGTQQGASTDANGEYTISGITPGTYTLQASFVGYAAKTQDGVEVGAGETTEVNFALAESEIALGEVTVTALGVERQERSLTYGQQSVGDAQIAEARELNIANSLSGAVSGISVNQAATGLGGDARVILRGNRSITGNSQPLWVVDGVPIRGDVSDLNPSDIEEINVLKGPNAAALYGSEAQNGAIIITTKRGREGELRFTFSQNFQFRDPILLTNYQNEYAQGSAGEYNSIAEASWGPRMDGQTVDFWSPNPERADEQYSLTAQPDNVSDAYQMGFNSTTNIAATVGSQSTQARFSYSYTDAEGIVPNNTLERHNVQGRVSTQIGDNLSLDGKLSYSREDIANQLSTGENFTNPIRHISRLPRNIRTEDAENFEYFTSEGLRRQHFWNPGSNGGANPYWTLNRNLNQNTTERVIAMTSLTYDFTDALSLMVRGSYDGGNSVGETELFNDTYIVADNGSYAQSRSNSWEANGDFLATYARDVLDDWSVEMNFGGNIKKERGGAVFTNTGQALTVPNFFTLSNTQNVVASESVGSPREVHSLYGFGQIGWRDAIYLDITGRNDWSSTLPADNRSYFYPSVGLSAVLTDLIPSFPSAVRFAKVRASWAEVGNSAPPFQTVRLANFSAGGNNGFLQLSTTLPAEDLVPEETVSWEVGTDLRFFRGQRLGLNVTAYKTNTRNQLFTAALPTGSGAERIFTNGGDVENRGIEVTLTGQPVITSDFTSSLDVNFSVNRSEVVRLTEDQPSLTIAQDFMREFRIVAGEPFGQVFSRGFQRDDEGRVIIGSDGMPLITDGLSVQVADFNADWRGSLRSSFGYKNVNLSFLIEHRQGGSTVSLTNAIIDADGLRERTLEGRGGGLIFGENFFSDETAVLEDGSPNDIEIDAETFWRGVGGRNAPVGEAFVEDATNTRLRQMTIGYALPQSIINTLPVSGVNFSVVGRNLFFLYRASSNLDPDLLVGTNAAAEGFESFTPPTTRQFGFNLQVQY